MFDFLWQLHQQRRINDVEDKAGEIGRRATDFQQRTRELEEQVDRLTLVNLAMWHLLRDRLNLTDGDLAAKVREVDLQDGVADGKVTRSIRECGKCGRALSARHKRCIYCGQAAEPTSPFDRV